MFDDLNDDNFMMYAMKCYTTPNCLMSEFEGDIKRTKYLKRLFRRYKVSKSLKERLILNHKNSICFRLATVFGFSYRMRTDLLVNNFVEKSVRKKTLEIFEPNFRRNFIHIRDVSSAIIFAINNFNKLKNNVFNLGLSSANLTKLALAKKIKKYYKNVKIVIIKNASDPDKRDYFVSNKKIEKSGFKPSISLDIGIKELLKLFSTVKIIFRNNY